MDPLASVPPKSGRGQRRVRNYLLDRHFQLKYSGYLVGIAVLISGCLGWLLWKSSQSVIQQSQRATEQGEQVVERGREVVAESRKVSAVVQLNIVKDPVYSESPELRDAFKTDSAKQDALLSRQQKALESQAAALRQQSADLLKQQRRTGITLVAILLVLVLLIGVAGIVVTHRVAGPVHKIRRLVRAVAGGQLPLASRLRKHDELVDFYHDFEAMLAKLRDRRERELATLEQAMTELESKSPSADLRELRAFRDGLKATLQA